MPWLKLTSTGPARSELVVLFGPGGILSAQESPRGYTVLLGENGSRLEVRETAAQIHALLALATA